MDTVKNTIKFDAKLVENNRQVKAQRKHIGALNANGGAHLKGNISHGVIRFFIDSVPGDDSATMTIDAKIPSITIESFIDFRSKVEELVGLSIASQLALASGNAEHPLEPGQCMNRYVACLFSNMFYQDFDVDRYLNGNHSFSGSNCPSQQCDKILGMIHDLDPEVLHFEGELQVGATRGGSNSAEVTISSIVVDFSDEGGQYSVPFVGYSDKIVLVSTAEEIVKKILIGAGELLKLLVPVK